MHLPFPLPHGSQGSALVPLSFLSWTGGGVLSQRPTFRNFNRFCLVVLDCFIGFSPPAAWALFSMLSDVSADILRTSSKFCEAKDHTLFYATWPFFRQPPYKKVPVSALFSFESSFKDTWFSTLILMVKEQTRADFIRKCINYVPNRKEMMAVTKMGEKQQKIWRKTCI